MTTIIATAKVISSLSCCFFQPSQLRGSCQGKNTNKNKTDDSNNNDKNNNNKKDINNRQLTTT